MPFATLSSRSLPPPGTPSPPLVPSINPRRDVVALAWKELVKVTVYRLTGNGELVWSWDGPGKVRMVEWDPQGNHLAVITAAKIGASTLTILSLQTGLPVHPPLAIAAVPTSVAWKALPSGPSAEPPAMRSVALPLVAQITMLSISREAAAVALASAKPAATLGGIAPGAAGAPGGLAAGGAAARGFANARQAFLAKEREKELPRVLTVEAAAPRWGALLADPAIESGTEIWDLKKKKREMGRLREEKLDDVLVSSDVPQSADDGAKDEDPSILALGDGEGHVHLLYGGTVPLGTILARGETKEEEVDEQVLSVVPTASQGDTLGLSMLASVSDTGLLQAHAVSLPFPPHLIHLVAESFTALRRLAVLTSDMVNDLRTGWDESRRVGKSWLSRLTEISKPQGISHAPATQLFQCLMTGRPSRALLDFLSSKMNERVYLKYESSTFQILQKARKKTWQGIQICAERVMLILDELRAWSEWNDARGQEGLDIFQLRSRELAALIELASVIVTRSVELDTLARRELGLFAQFSQWMKYELAKIAQQDASSDTKPQAPFDPVQVALYIRQCLITSPISPYLDFGLQATSLDKNAEYSGIEAWWEASLEAPAADETEGRESLPMLLRRLKEELRGQADAAYLASQRVLNGEREQETLAAQPITVFGGDDFDPPSPVLGGGGDPDMEYPQVRKTGERAGASSDSVEDDEDLLRWFEFPSARAHLLKTKSLPALMFFLSSRLGEIAGRVFERVSAGSERQGSREVGQMTEAATEEVSDEQEVEGRPPQERRVGVWIYTAWPSRDAFCLKRRKVASPDDVELEDCNLPLVLSVDGSTAPIDIVDFDFFDDDEIVLLTRPRGGPTVKGDSRLSTLRYREQPYATSTGKAGGSSANAIQAARTHLLDAHYPAGRIAVNGRKGRRLACVLAGDGRRFETLDLEDDDDEEMEE